MRLWCLVEVGFLATSGAWLLHSPGVTDVQLEEMVVLQEKIFFHDVCVHLFIALGNNFNS